MQLYRLTALIGACWCLVVSARADTLTFIGQPVVGGIDDNWFNAINWFTTNSSGTLVPAGRVPLADEGALLTGTVDLQASGVRVQTLVATNNATITNGTMAAENLQLLTGSSINGVNVNVLTQLIVGGTNCTLNASTLTILSIASGTLQALAPATASSLVLTQGSALVIDGSLSLTDGSQISGGGLPQSQLSILQGAVLISTNSTTVIGSNGSHLIIDNSGTVRADGGTLMFSNGIDWRCSSGTEEFRAAGPASTIAFTSPFHVDSSVSSSFTGAGTNIWLAGGTIDGAAQVSALDPNTQLAGPGHLELLGSITGAGTVHIIGTTNQGGVGSWIGGSLGLPSLSVDPGANLLIGGNASFCQLTGCIITNQGLCTFLGGDFDFSQGGVFNNQLGALFEIQSDGAFSSAVGGGVLNNFGTFQKLSAGTSAFIVTNANPGPDFNNNGLLDVHVGQLNLLGGSSSGTFSQTPGTLLWFWGGTHSFNTGASFTGSGTVRLSEGTLPAKWLLNDSISIPQLEVGTNGAVDSSGVAAATTNQIGTLFTHDNALITNGSFQIDTFKMLDQSTVASASINVGTSLTVGGTNCTLESATLNLSASASGILEPPIAGAGVKLTLENGSVLQNSGKLTLTAGTSIGLLDGALINNQSGATLELQTNVVLGLTPASGSASIINAGTFLMSAPGLSVVSAPFANSGKLEIQSGTLAFQGSWNQTQGATLIDSGATLSGTNLTVTGGSVSGTGTIAANVVNTGGTVSPGPAFGILSTGTGQNYQQGSAADLAFEIGGTGPGTQFDQFIVGGAASLDGQLVVSFANGFAAEAGQMFQVLTAGSLSGKFARISAPTVPGATWVARYGTNNVTLLAASSVTLTPPSISSGSLTFSINTMPGMVYVVQATDQLTAPDWLTIKTIMGDGTTKTVSEVVNQSNRFYRIVIE
jgi:fibronectin-binding autotransporter adhesin